MKICQIGPGIMEIPPKGWGAVEQLIWDYYQILNMMGHEVDIINTPDPAEIIQQVKVNKYDAVHLHYDCFHPIISNLDCPVKIISSHYPYINLSYKWPQDGYNQVFDGIRYATCDNVTIFASSKEDISTFIQGGVNPQRIWHSKLGVRAKNYSYLNKPLNDRTLCLGKITDRKRQWSIQNIPNIDFIGRMDHGRFNPSNPSYIGELSRSDLNSIITEYSNFILLSEAENATPLVVKEALIAGLGVVVSECCALELDPSFNFITIIPNNKLDDIRYIMKAIEENKRISVSERPNIREYGIYKFALESILPNEYIPKIEELINEMQSLSLREIR